MKIIIPMTGLSSRFKQANIKTPKQFLKIKNKMIIEHILDMFPGENNINLIVNKEDLKNPDLQQNFKKLTKYNIIPITHQVTGPGGALLKSGVLETNDPVLINYCDFANIWNWHDLKSFALENNFDGVIPAYKGLHPHSIYGNDYAFIKNEKHSVLEIKEKQSFTDEKMNEYASSGSYFFKTGFTAKKYIKKTFDNKNFVNGEVYISTPYEEMLKDKLKVALYEIEHFFQWGTPEDFKEFLYNLEEVNNILDKSKINLKNINLLIPAAGEGKRFKEKNYSKSKIFLEINNSSLIHNIISSFYQQIQTSILILEKDYKNVIDKNGVLQFLKIKKKTSGQAESASLLIESIENDSPVLIHSADCILDKNISVDIGSFDVVVYTKKNYRRAFSQELNYGWVNSTNNIIDSLSIKKKPKSSNSNVIVGSFLFKNKDIFKTLYEETLKNQTGVNEIHIDHLVEMALNLNLKVKEIVSEKTVMLGTPVEYELFKYMNTVYNYFAKND